MCQISGLPIEFLCLLAARQCSGKVSRLELEVEVEVESEGRLIYHDRAEKTISGLLLPH